ncbi:sulfotransferase [Sphingomonas sp. MMS24-J13]|uniref:tetratricopeptide repeat-containing sulfotransferase family protein n=1 Tax=Sphingomonas sp. MMS24-J13 TaxID=3238686 RepID=UPI00385012A8
MRSKIRQQGSKAAPAPQNLRPAIEQALAASDIARAAELAETALARGQSDPMFLNLVAWRREEMGDYEGAHRILLQALALAPGDILIRGAIGAVLRKEGRLDEALRTLDQVLAAAPHHAAGWLERGYVLDTLRQRDGARESYQRAVAIDPYLAPALGKLADLAAQAGETETGRRFAVRALQIDTYEPAAIAALATIDIEAKDGAAAEAKLRALLRPALVGDDRTRTLTLLGDALDRQDRTAEAFASWQAAQANFRSIYAPLLSPSSERPSHRTFIDHIAAQVRAAPVMARPAVSTEVDGAARGHVFLLGYPRSGTTLVENVLASAPEVKALEERDTLADTDEVLVRNDGTMPDLDALDPALLADLRAGYWRRVRSMAGDVSGQIFVDMNPFNGIKLPIIARLFPDAKILIMRRDPRDVVLSCYRINFTPSPAAWSFSELDETARHYDALMTLTELCRQRLALDYHEVRYDRLVADFEATVTGFAHFIGLEWTEAFRTFDRTAQNRGVRTASATQVRRGLYDGRGQWRRYTDQLAPVLPILAPWVERFGFRPD